MIGKPGRYPPAEARVLEDLMTQPEWQQGQGEPDPTRAYPPGQQPAAAYPPAAYPGQPGYQQVGVPVDAPTARRTVAAGKLWAGGLATAIVAALIAVAGILIARGVLDIPILSPEEQGAWGDASTLTYALAAFAVGLVATGLMHALLMSTPSPFTFFGWIMGLVTVVGAALPFTSGAALDSKIATAVINALIGIAVWTLTDSSGQRSLRVVRPAPGRR